MTFVGESESTESPAASGSGQIPQPEPSSWRRLGS